MVDEKNISGGKIFSPKIFFSSRKKGGRRDGGPETRKSGNPKKGGTPPGTQIRPYGLSNTFDLRSRLRGWNILTNPVATGLG